MTGNDDQPDPARAALVTHHLREAGYHTAGAGKFHFTSYRTYPPDSLDHLGFDEVSVTEDPKHGSWLDWIAAEHPEHYDQALATTWPMPYLSDYPPDGRDLRPAWEAAVAHHLTPLQQPPNRRIVHPSSLPAGLHQSSWITDQALRMIDRAPQDQPLFCYVSYVDPHDPYDPPEPYWSRYDWRDLPAPAAREWGPGAQPWQYPEFVSRMFELDTFDDETWARLRAAFYGSCRFVDDQIQRILTHLDRTGLGDNTVVLFTSDHGDVIGDHGLGMKGPWHYDQTIRTPLIMAGPGVACGTRQTGLSSGLDVCPTLLDLAGVPVATTRDDPVAPGPYLGRVLPYRSGADRAGGHGRLLVETNASYLSERDPVRTVLTADGWRLTEFPGQTYGEMFDLTADPHEQHNHYTDPAHTDRRADLTNELVAATCDASLIGRT